MDQNISIVFISLSHIQRENMKINIERLISVYVGSDYVPGTRRGGSSTTLQHRRVDGVHKPCPRLRAPPVLPMGLYPAPQQHCLNHCTCNIKTYHLLLERSRIKQWY
jgi:hypothetical protein